MTTLDDNNNLLLRLEKLNAIGIALSSEQDIDRLLEIILIAAKDITHADGGTLYRMVEDNQVRSLRFEIVRTDSLHLAFGGTTGNPITFAPLPLIDEQGHPNNSMVAVYAAVNKQTVNIADAYTEAGFDFSGTKKFDQNTGYRSQSFLTVPMMNHEDAVIGVLQLINSTDQATGKVTPFSPAEKQLAESLASQAAIALTNRQLIIQLEELFESFIQLINVAIDEKSPYTGGHCERVPVLTMMLAEAVNQTTRGPLASFSMSDRDLYELKIAGLLHDCGKVTTPVHVVDKATKLQTLYDRIHTIDTRFEVLKRDAEIAMLRKQMALREQCDAAAELSLQSECSAHIAQLDDARNFLRHANIGGETMRPEDQQRISEIGTNNPWRGIDGQESPLLSPDEIENLSIRAGTLTQAERETINSHIVATIKMLKKLPWPRHLQHVPEYAGGHHERMDGKGYPNGLTRDQMSIQARIMGIADIFEALTAKDRPYKEGKTLSESLFILGKFKENGHIDPDLFDIFVHQKVYLRYAKQFLNPTQIDDVDERKIPGYVT